MGWLKRILGRRRGKSGLQSQHPDMPDSAPKVPKSKLASPSHPVDLLLSKPDMGDSDKLLFGASRAKQGIRFVRKYTEPGKSGHTNTYEIYVAQTAAAARAFLLGKKVKKALYYLVVETPDGNWGLDINGLYLERMLPWQCDLASAQIDGVALSKMPPIEDLANVAAGRRDNFVHEVECGTCRETWHDALRYQNRTIVKCPRCGFLNCIDTSNFIAIEI